MTSLKALITVTFASTLLLGLSANAQGSCVFTASESVNYWTSYPGPHVYGFGPVSFVWEPSTGRILGGYYPERAVTYTTVLTYFNNVVSGSITAGPVGPSLNLSLTMNFARSVPDSYGFVLNNATLTGTADSARLSGMLDGPYLFEATGTVSCY